MRVLPSLPLSQRHEVFVLPRRPCPAYSHRARPAPSRRARGAAPRRARSVSAYVTRPRGASRRRFSPSLRLAHSGPPKSRRRGKATGQSQSHDQSPRRAGKPAARTATWGKASIQVCVSRRRHKIPTPQSPLASRTAQPGPPVLHHERGWNDARVGAKFQVSRLIRARLRSMPQR